jgi:glycerol-3-phosphate dehydrogenase (NAD(P)+)
VSAAERGGLVEGVYSAESITQLARKLGVRMPICSAVSEVISGKKSVPDALMQLLKRPAAEELSD